MTTEIITALVKAQLEIEAPAKDKFHSHKKYYYSSIDAIYDAIRKPLAKNGLCLSHSVTDKEGKPYLVTTLIHVSGQQISNTIPMFIQGVGSQDFGSALTYGRRYAICSLLALPTEDDEDGERANDIAKNIPTKTEKKKLTQENVDTLKKFNNKTAEYSICEYYKKNSLDEFVGVEMDKDEYASIYKSLKG